MVGHQTVGIGGGNWQDILAVQLQEIAVVTRLIKEGVAVIAAIIDMVKETGYEWLDHGFALVVVEDWQSLLHKR